jgi:hypothetical protein
MNTTEKLLFGASLGRNVYGRWKFKRVMAALVTIIALAFTAAVIISLLAIGGSYAAYLYFIDLGATPMSALLIISLIILVLALFVTLMIQRRMHALKSPMSSTPIGEAVDAFLDGLLGE